MKKDRNTFKVGKSRIVRYVTLVVWLAVVAACIAIIAKSFGEVTNFYFSVPITAALLGIILYYTLISPTYVELTDNALVVHRVLGHKTFKYSDIEAIGKWEQGPVGLLRICGSGAFCGYIGWFSCEGLGRHFEYVGQYSDAFYILLRSGKRYMLSCENNAEVVRRVSGMAGRTAQSRPSSE